MFTQDFDLFQHSTTQTPVPHRRAPSLDSTLQRSFNAEQATFSPNVNLNSNQTINSAQSNQRSTRPQVPLFHSNSTGNLGNQQNIPQYQHVSALTNFDMGGAGNLVSALPSAAPSLIMASEINVAYEGTFGDLSSAGNATLFNMNDNFDFTHLMGGTDGFTPINDIKPNGVTVSPKDVFNSDSVPPSTSFTNLTTPGSTLLETPDEDYETSPLFTDNFGIGNHAADNWFSLFPDDNGANNTPAPMMARTTSASSGQQIVVHPGGEGNRKRSSTIAMSPPATFSPAVKHSNVAGVNARKRDKPLPPIVVDENDSVALKRARNTAAARKSRAKKVQERDDLENIIGDLQAQVAHWKSVALSLGAKEEDADE